MRVTKEWVQTYCNKFCGTFTATELEKYPTKKGYLVDLTKLGKELAEKGILRNPFDLFLNNVGNIGWWANKNLIKKGA